MEMRAKHFRHSPLLGARRDNIGIAKRLFSLKLDGI
jgi:hypothetical protein